MAVDGADHRRAGPAWRRHVGRRQRTAPPWRFHGDQGSTRVIVNCTRSGKTRRSVHCAAGPLLAPAAGFFRWNLFCSRKSSEFGLTIIAVPPTSRDCALGSSTHCFALRSICSADAWGPFAPVVVDRPFAKIVATLNRLDWFEDEQERAGSQ